MLKHLSVLALTMLLCSWTHCVAAQTAPSRPSRPAPVSSTVDVSFDVTDPGAGDPAEYKTEAKYTHQLNPATQLLFEVEQRAKLGDPDAIILVGASHAFGARRALLLEVHAAAGPDSDYVAKREFNLKTEWRFHRLASPVFEYERSFYTGDAVTDEITVGVKLTPIGAFSSQVMYTATNAQLTAKTEQLGHAVAVDSAWRVNHRWSLSLVAGYGHEQSLARNKTIYEVTRSSLQLTLQPGVDVKLSATRGLRIAYCYEDKKKKEPQHGLVVGGYVAF
jgi:hypothetical protein